MNVTLSIILTVQMLSALSMIGLILIQHGKGADMGAAFGSGSSGSLFGASGSANFLSRTTAVLASVFFACTLALAYFGNVRPVGVGSVLERTDVSSPAPLASPAGAEALIPGAEISPPASTSTAPAPVAPVAPGPAQIPAK